MLTKIITAIILLIAVVSLLLYAPLIVLEAVAALIWVLALWEFLKFTNCKPRWLVMLAIVALAAALRWMSGYAAEIAIMVAVGFWAAAFLAVLFFPKTKYLFQHKIILVVAAVCMFVPSWLSIHLIYNKLTGIWLLFLCALTWLADSGAYFVGKAFGQRLLLPEVSPKKTWAGVVGALAAAGLGLLGAVCFLPELQSFSLSIAILSVLVPAVVFGDLVESAYKRTFAVKDSGSLLPGHGGVHDRIDSMLAVLPIMQLWLQFLQSHV